jgi:hypothetical protein
MEMISLYDHLGKAGGKELGARVTASATSMGVPLDTRYVKNPVYEGNVVLYPANFLKLYFQANG